MQIYGSLSIYLCPPFSETICKQARHTVLLLCPPNEGATYSNYRTEGLDQNEDRHVKTVPCTILAVLSATETILLQNYHEQFPPFPINTNPPYDLISLSIVYHMLFY